jgi:type IV secretory pathway VirJ component
MPIGWCQYVRVSETTGQFKEAETMLTISYDDIFRSDAEAAEQLNSDDAICAIGVLMMTIDGEIANLEVSYLHEALEQLDRNLEQIEQMYAKVMRILNQNGPGALFNAAMAGLAPEQKETAFEVAVRVALADKKVVDAENDCLVALAEKLNLSSECMITLIDRAIAANDN